MSRLLGWKNFRTHLAAGLQNSILGIAGAAPTFLKGLITAKTGIPLPSRSSSAPAAAAASQASWISGTEKFPDAGDVVYTKAYDISQLVSELDGHLKEGMTNTGVSTIQDLLSQTAILKREFLYVQSNPASEAREILDRLEQVLRLQMKLEASNS